MAASWPPTSGATRISVMRTMPTSGGMLSERHSTATARPAATRAKPTAMTTSLLAIDLPPFQEEHGHRCQHEIDDCQNPQAPPVARHLPKARAQLVDAHEAVNREIGGEDIT